MKYTDKTPLEKIHENLESIKTELLSRDIGLSCGDYRICTCLGCALSEIRANLELISPRVEKSKGYIVSGSRKGKVVYQEYVELVSIDQESETSLKQRIKDSLALDSIDSYKLSQK